MPSQRKPGATFQKVGGYVDSDFYPDNAMPDGWTGADYWSPLKKTGSWWKGDGGSGVSNQGGIFGGGPTLGLLPSAPYVQSRPEPGINELEVYQVGNAPVLRFDLTIRDFSGGLDLAWAEIGPGSVPNMAFSATLDISHSRTCTLLPKVDEDTTSANLAASWKGALHVTHLDNETFDVIVGAGSTANKSLFRLQQLASAGTWEEDFTVEPQTFSPPSAISCLGSARIVTKVPRVIIGYADDPAHVLSGIDGSPTDVGAMHSNLEPTWGVEEVGLNSTTPGYGTLIFYANGGFWILDGGTSAINDAPTQKLSGINNGGFIVGQVEYAGAPIRLIYVEPKEDLAKTSMFDTNAATSGAPTAVGRVRSVDLEASNPQDVDVGLDYVIDCKKWRNGTVQTDGQQVTWLNGQIIDLSWNRERSWSSDAIVSIHGIEVIGTRLFVRVIERTASTAYLSFDEYILEENAWYPAFERYELNTGIFASSVRETPFLHYFDRDASAPATHRMFWGVGLTTGDGITRWRSAPLWPSSYNPYYSQTTGNMPRPFASSGSLTSLILHFFEGLPKCVTDITYMGQLDPGGSVEIEIAEQGASSMSFTGNQAATFKAADRWDKHYWVNPSPSLWDRLQYRLNATQGSSPRLSGNYVPFKIGGYIWFNRNKPMDPTPQQLESFRFD